MTNQSDHARHIFRPDEKLFLRSMGKSLRITAIFTDTDEANAWMRRHNDDAVIAAHGDFVFLANKYDRGID